MVGHQLHVLDGPGQSHSPLETHLAVHAEQLRVAHAHQLLGIVVDPQSRARIAKRHLHRQHFIQLNLPHHLIPLDHHQYTLLTLDYHAFISHNHVESIMIQHNSPHQFHTHSSINLIFIIYTLLQSPNLHFSSTQYHYLLFIL